MKTLYIITNFQGIVPQKLSETVGLDLDIMIKELSCSLECKIINIDSLSELLLSDGIKVKDELFFLCSSQDECYKHAILDVAFEINERGGVLIPGLAFYLSHENKYYQEFYKKRKGIPTPLSKLVTNSMNLPEFTNPCVVKPYGGFASRGVTLAKSNNQLHQAILKNLDSYVTSGRSFVDLVKKFFKKHVYFRDYYPSHLGRVVIQDFIPNLKYDWKVLVFGNEVFVLKRFTRTNDFRASGSGNFDYNEEPSNALVTFAVEIREKLDTPFVSIDVAESANGELSIIEFQSVHFGLATIMNALNCYQVVDDRVNKVSVNDLVVEKLFCKSIIQYIEFKKYE